ncbi:PTH2 [Sanghuangporus sanghuang]
MALTTRLPSARVEPFYGFVETTGDALRLIQAARQGIIPRITRRLNDLERRAMIRSGAIFIFSDEESGIKRWTEGLSWSASRIVGNFLVYREVSDRSNARTVAEGRRAAKRRGNTNELSAAELAEQKLAKALVGCLSDGSGRFKPNGLIKKTITINVDGSDHHLIAYYNQDDVRLGRLLPLTSRLDIMALEISPELLESTKFRIPPIMHEALDGRPRYMWVFPYIYFENCANTPGSCDAEDGDIPRHIGVPLPSLPQVSATLEATLDNEPRSQNSSMYTDLLWTNEAPQPIFNHSYRTRISPSPLSSMSSNLSDDTFGWSSAGDSHGTSYLPHPVNQQYQSGAANQAPQESSNPASTGTFRGTIALVDRQSNSPPNPLPIHGEDLRICARTTEIGHDPSSCSHRSALASRTAPADFMRPIWGLPHYAPSFTTTPTQSRCTQRSTSLPSLCEYGGFNVPPPVSHAHYSPKAVTIEPVLPQADTLALLHALARFPTAA